jgi:hypothetical protein
MSHSSPAVGAPGAALPAGSMRLGSPDLLGPCHACAFFLDPEEEYRVLLPFAADCARCGERCLHFIDPLRDRERRERLAEAGVEVSETAAGGRAELRSWDDVYLRGGRFDQDEMLALIEEAMTMGRPFGRTRLWANMEWVLKGLPGSDDLIEYESRLNPIIDKHTDVVICAYEHGKYSASVVMDILRAHPMVIIGDVLQQNPLYVPTEQFLEDLRQRRAARPGLRSEAGGLAGA